MRVSDLVPKDHGFCRNARRDIRLQKLLRGIVYVYGLFSENIDDRKAIVPMIYKKSDKIVRGDWKNSLAHTSSTIMYYCIRINMLRSHFVYTTATQENLQLGNALGKRKACLPYEVSAST